MFLVREGSLRNHGRGLLVAAFGAVLYQGCGGRSSDRAAPSASAGLGGTSAHSAGGTQSRGKGGSSSLGGETEGAGAAAIPAQAGAGEGGSDKGGEPGRGGATGGHGGTATAGATGGTTAAGATGGTSGVEGLDLDCTCTFPYRREFSCTIPLGNVPSVFLDPLGECSQVAAVLVGGCDGNRVGYQFQVSQETAYELELDGDQPTYFRASGHVEALCGLDPAGFDTGAVTAGSPGHCGGSCALCGEWPNVSSCCPSDPVRPLEDYCAEERCPATAEAAVEQMAGACDSDDYALVRKSTGCGVVRVEPWLDYPKGSSPDPVYLFDAATGELIGVHRWASENPLFECPVRGIVWGDVSHETCAEAVTCIDCWAGAGAGGAPSVDEQCE